MLLGTEVIRSNIKKLLGIFDSLSCALEIELKLINLFILLTRLSSFVIILIFVVLDFTPHFGTLSLHHINFLLNILNLIVKLIYLISLSITFITEATSLKILLVQESLRSLKFFSEVLVLLVLFLQHVLEVFLLLTTVSNIVHATI